MSTRMSTHTSTHMSFRELELSCLMHYDRHLLSLAAAATTADGAEADKLVCVDLCVQVQGRPLCPQPQHRTAPHRMHARACVLACIWTHVQARSQRGRRIYLVTFALFTHLHRMSTPHVYTTFLQHMSTHVSAHVSIHVSTHVSVHVSVHVSIHVSAAH